MPPSSDATDDHNHAPAEIINNGANKDGEEKRRQNRRGLNQATVTSEVEIVAMSQLSATACIGQPRLGIWLASKIDQRVLFSKGANSLLFSITALVICLACSASIVQHDQSARYGVFCVISR